MSIDNRHLIALPYWARPGIMTATDDDGQGGGGSDDSDDEDEDEDDSDDGQDEDDAKTDQELRDELKVTRARLKKANDSSAKRRRALAEARKPKPAAEPKKDDDKVDVEKVREEARAEATEAGNTRLKKASIRASLKASGVPVERVGKLVNLVELDDLDVDDDGEVDGLDDALDTLKTEWPELFPVSKRRKRSVAGEGDRDGQGDKGGGNLSASERQARIIRGQ